MNSGICTCLRSEQLGHRARTAFLAGKVQARDIVCCGGRHIAARRSEPLDHRTVACVRVGAEPVSCALGAPSAGCTLLAAAASLPVGPVAQYSTPAQAARCMAVRPSASLSLGSGAKPFGIESTLSTSCRGLPRRRARHRQPRARTGRTSVTGHALAPVLCAPRRCRRELRCAAGSPWPPRFTSLGNVLYQGLIQMCCDTEKK